MADKLHSFIKPSGLLEFDIIKRQLDACVASVLLL